MWLLVVVFVFSGGGSSPRTLTVPFASEELCAEAGKRIGTIDTHKGRLLVSWTCLEGVK